MLGNVFGVKQWHTSDYNLFLAFCIITFFIEIMTTYSITLDICNL